MEISKWVEFYKEDVIKDLQGLLAIRSVKGEARDGKPFGEGPYRALQYVLDLGISMGFEIKNVDNYAGHIEYGNGNEIIGVLVHLDVVPEGEEPWIYPPYSGEVHEGRIYGRGVIDNKGPAIAALYALKALKESKVHLNRKIRLILGTNEESGWGCIRYYLKKEKAPDMAFSPDAGFPVIHAEKGILVFNLIKEFSSQWDKGPVLKSIKGGNAPNMVADKCTAVLESEDITNVLQALSNFTKITGYHLTSEIEGNLITIVSTGKSAHGAFPEKGLNAISEMMLFLSQLEFANQDLNSLIKFYADHIGMEYNGQSIGCGFEDEVSGKLTFNVGMIEVDEQKGKIKVDVRYPVSMDSEAVLKALRDKTKNMRFEIICDGDLKPKYVPKDHQLVKTLMEVYRKHTEDYDSEPFVIGGGTYARAIEMAVAFGTVFIGQESLEHQKNEYVEIDLLIKAAKIFADAMYELAK
jgi:succinyl-diaminopimelate desuccinylase